MHHVYIQDEHASQNLQTLSQYNMAILRHSLFNNYKLLRNYNNTTPRFYFLQYRIPETEVYTLNVFQTGHCIL